MLFDSEENQEKTDYFESAGTPQETSVDPKKPTYTPDDPAYWEEDESEWEHLKPRNSVAPWLWLGAVVLAVAVATGVWLRYFSAYIDDASQVGYVENIERRGTIFKTYEGILLPYKELMDTTRIYTRDFIFTADNESIAIVLKKAQFAIRPVRVSYKKYHATVPWRGSGKILVTGVDSIDVDKILPPDFAPSRRH